MAGDRWVIDIIFHVSILVPSALGNLWSAWSTEILLILSFGMQLVLTIFATLRWHGASAMMNVIWFCYVGGDYVATAALGHLSVSSTSGEHQLLAFWAPFFLLHLGGPDNITAYQLEDNELSARYVLELILRVLGALYVVYKSIFGSSTLVAAAWLMLLVGVAKYVEKIMALHRANLRSIRKSVKTDRRQFVKDGRRYTNTMLQGDKENDNTALVMVAHSLFYICKRAMVDSSVEMEPDYAQANRITLFDKGWQGMLEIMEMELSLMYDFLYTKAAVIHTWHGYSIRVYSPLATAVALLLLEFSYHSGHRHADVMITRMLLVSTLLLETTSLVRVLGSSWTAFLLYSTPQWGWLHHHVFCSTHWHRFRRATAYVNNLLFKVEGHRKWSGKIGQLNLLQLSTSEQPSRAAKENVGQNLERDEKRSSKTIVIPQKVKELVFGKISRNMVDLRNKIRQAQQIEGLDAADLVMKVIESRTKWGRHALQNAFGASDLFEDFRVSLGFELQDGILTWHIATDIYLVMSEFITNKARDDLVNAISTLSNYMMFLLAQRPHMLPGLDLRRLYELTYEDLVRINCSMDHHDLESSSNFQSSWRKISQTHADPGSYFLSKREEKLAMILYYYDEQQLNFEIKSYLSGAIKLARNLISVEKRGKENMLKLMLEVWVEMLFYTSYRCSRESHARQLSSGGEFTSIVWLLAEHIGLFTINTKARAALVDDRKRRKEVKHA